MDRDDVFWKAVTTAKELLLQAVLLQKSSFHNQADRAVYKAGFLLMTSMQEKAKTASVPPELADLFTAFTLAHNPYERFELIQKIKDFE